MSVVLVKFPAHKLERAVLVFRIALALFDTTERVEVYLHLIEPRPQANPSADGRESVVLFVKNDGWNLAHPPQEDSQIHRAWLVVLGLQVQVELPSLIEKEVVSDNSIVLYEKHGFPFVQGGVDPR